jgi:hypothetical protein
MSLQFVLTITLLSWHNYTPLRKFNGCEPTAAVGKTTKRILYQIIGGVKPLFLRAEHHVHHSAFHIRSLLNLTHILK